MAQNQNVLIVVTFAQNFVINYIQFTHKNTRQL